ncbi:MAG: NTP transferase domain-containing protein [Elusimicrobia bacterium]|nr:NTP transferase domain-containing protein [Elusimicrobiota bacterium]
MKDLKTIILAAGKGTRFKSDLPKVLHCVAGRPAIDHVLDVAKALGSLRTYVVVGHKANEVRKVIGSRAEVVIQKRLLGTADAVRSCAPHFRQARGTVLVMCGDTPLLDKAVVRRLVQAHHKAKAACTVLSAVLSEPHGYGRIIRDASGSFVAIREEKDASPSEKMVREINTGVYCFDAALLFSSISKIRVNPKKKEFYLTDIIELFLSRHRTVRAVVTEDWTANIGINTRADLALCERICRERILKKLMSCGVTIVDPATTYVEQDVRIGRDTIIYPCSYIHRDVQVGKGCSIGPFARLRPGTRLGAGVAVGNFTEVSRSTLGPGVTMKHFSFLGDARVGAGSNIGCGTVTANYDGKNKNRTVIGPKAFIGSDAVIVAPARIGAGAVLGAGSVLTANRSVPPGGVAVGVPARTIKRVKKNG